METFQAMPTTTPAPRLRRLGPHQAPLGDQWKGRPMTWRITERAPAVTAMTASIKGAVRTMNPARCLKPRREVLAANEVGWQKTRYMLRRDS
jgi:hypothetical protein